MDVVVTGVVSLIFSFEDRSGGFRCVCVRCRTSFDALYIAAAVRSGVGAALLFIGNN